MTLSSKGNTDMTLPYCFDLTLFPKLSDLYDSIETLALGSKDSLALLVDLIPQLMKKNKFILETVTLKSAVAESLRKQNEQYELLLTVLVYRLSNLEETAENLAELSKKYIDKSDFVITTSEEEMQQCEGGYRSKAKVESLTSFSPLKNKYSAEVFNIDVTNLPDKNSKLEHSLPLIEAAKEFYANEVSETSRGTKSDKNTSTKTKKSRQENRN